MSWGALGCPGVLRLTGEQTVCAILPYLHSYTLKCLFLVKKETNDQIACIEYLENVLKMKYKYKDSGFTDIKTANVLHHPVQAKNMNFNP